LAGHVGDEPCVALLDSGASGAGFIDPTFAARCGVVLGPSDRLVQLADGSTVRAAGQAEIHYTLTASKGPPVPFRSVLTATPLQGYDFVLGVGWLAEHDVLVGWRNRSLEVRTPGRPPRHIRPMEVVDDPKTPARIASISVKDLRKAMKRGEVEELFVVRAQPSEDNAPPPVDPAVAQLLKEYADAFPDKLPNVLPPKRGVEHTILLKPGATPPPARPLRHQSAKDLAVFQEYVREGLESGQLRVSNSP
jgi:hypothetical protein